MKKKDREASGWNEWTAQSITDLVTAAEAGTLADDYNKLHTMCHYLTAQAAHAAWHIEAARRHPDQGGSAELSARFGEVWDRIEKSFPKVAAAAA